MAIPRILYDNKIAAAGTVLSASSEEITLPVLGLPDQARGRRWRSKTGWTIVPGFNDEFPYWTTNDLFRIAHIVPGTYATGAAKATALQTAMGLAGANPLAIGPSLWLRADAVNVTNGLITQFNDISGNNRHAAQASSALQATFVANAVDGRPGAYFPGDAARGYATSALMSAMLAATTGRSTIVWVFKLDSDAAANDGFWSAGSAGHFMSAYWSAGVNFSAQVYTTGDVTATKAAALGVNAWQNGWFEYDGTNVQSYMSDADSAAVQNAAQTGNVHADVLSSVLNIGQSTILKGYLLELIVFPGTLGQPDRRQVVQYLRGRYPSMAANDATTAHTWTDTNTATYSATTKKFTVATNAAQLKILAATGTPVEDRTASAYIDLGFALSDKTGAATYTADNAAYQSRHWIKADLGSALAILSAIALDHNAGAAGTFTLQGNSIDLWLAPTQSQALSGDAAQRSAYFGSSSQRLLRLVIDDVQNTAGYSELGIWYAGPYFQPPAWHTSWVPGYKDLGEESFAAFGAGHLNVKPRRDTHELRWNGVSNANRASFVTFTEATPVGKCFFFLFDTNALTNILYVTLASELQTPHGRKWWSVLMSIREALA